MRRTFHLLLEGDSKPQLIVSADAMCQMREAKKQAGKKVISFFEVFKRPLSNELSDVESLLKQTNPELSLNLKSALFVC